MTRNEGCDGPDEFQPMSKEISGVDDRETHNKAGMVATLERLAAALEP